MNILENIRMAISSLRSHKMRSILTMLGIVIGVGSVIAVIGIGQAGEAILKSQIVGETNTIEIYHMPSDEEFNSNTEPMGSQFTSDDIKLIEKIPEVNKVVSASSEFANIRYREDKEEASITGINEAYIDVNKLKIATGRRLLPADFLAGKKTAIISNSLKDKLFEEEEVLGKVIFVSSHPIKIVGVLEKESGLFSGNSELYVPSKTWKTIFSKNGFSQISIQTNDPDSLNIAAKKATEMLNRVHGKDNEYQAMNMKEIAEGIGQITSIMTIIIGSIAGVSLFVGGIGVMNIMLVSVTERTREIGVRMSLGATRSQILFQFLIESVALTLIGGLMGILLGTGGVSVLSYFAGWPSIISIPVIIGGILFSMIIGIIFGILPASNASKLNPIESLRYE